MRSEVAEIIEDIVDSGPDTADGDIPTESVHAKELVTGDIVVFGRAGEKRKWLMIVAAKPAGAGIVELTWPEGEPMQLFWAAGERVRRVRRLADEPIPGGALSSFSRGRRIFSRSAPWH